MRYLIYLTISLILITPTAGTPFTIVIDPGHGGKFIGNKSCSGKFKEKDLNLAVALKLNAILIKHKDIVSILTRNCDMHFDNDLLQDLFKRVDIAQKHNPDLFVSVHANYSSSAQVRGFEIYVPMNTNFPAQSYNAAACIHHKMALGCDSFFSGRLGNLNIYDRGIRAAKFNVIKSLPYPALLIELDYISNRKAEEKLSCPKYQQKIAEIIAEGIIQYMQEAEIQKAINPKIPKKTNAQN